MTITAKWRENSGTSVAECTCDRCGAQAEIPSRFAEPRKSENLPGGKTNWRVRSEGEVIAKLRKKGWSYATRSGLICPACVLSVAALEVAAELKKPKPKLRTEPMAQAPTPTETPAPLRQPSREQRRQIMELLTTCYDTQKERYSGTDTDQTIADCIGGGVLFGWVAQVREEFFGPDGGNDELESILADIAAQIDREQARTASLKTLMEQAAPIFQASQATIQELETIRSRVLALKRALGAKGSRA